MESRIEVHKCIICGRECVLTLISIGTTHQWVAQVICPDCVTPEHRRRVGRYPAKDLERDKERDYSGCHCERSEAIPKPQGGDCFVAKNAPRNDTG